jgi:hypothetical protein
MVFACRSVFGLSSFFSMRVWWGLARTEARGRVWDGSPAKEADRRSKVSAQTKTIWPCLRIDRVFFTLGLPRLLRPPHRRPAHRIRFCLPPRLSDQHRWSEEPLHARSRLTPRLRRPDYANSLRNAHLPHRGLRALGMFSQRRPRMLKPDSTLALSDALVLVQRVESASVVLWYVVRHFSQSDGQAHLTTTHTMRDHLLTLGQVLQHARRCLAPEGNLLAHSEPEMNGSIRLLLDQIFGRENSRQAIIVSRKPLRWRGQPAPNRGVAGPASFRVR